MNKTEEALKVAGNHAQSIVNSTTAPYDGAKSIVWEACHPLNHVPSELMVFVGLESEYADFSDATRIQYYGEKHSKEFRGRIETRILEAAKKLLAAES